MRFVITGVDTSSSPRDMRAQLPIAGEILRKIPGPDSPNYFLAKVNAPITWDKENGVRTISHLVLHSRSVGHEIAPQQPMIGISIGYITDLSILDDASLEFKKYEYVAIGIAKTE